MKILIKMINLIIKMSLNKIIFKMKSLIKMINLIIKMSLNKMMNLTIKILIKMILIMINLNRIIIKRLTNNLINKSL